MLSRLLKMLRLRRVRRRRMRILRAFSQAKISNDRAVRKLGLRDYAYQLEQALRQSTIPSEHRYKLSENRADGKLIWVACVRMVILRAVMPTVRWLFAR